MLDQVSNLVLGSLLLSMVLLFALCLLGGFRVVGGNTYFVCTCLMDPNT